MTRQRLYALLAFGAALAAASLFLRALTDGEYEVQTIDLILLVIPLLIVAIATGKLKNLDFFGLKADLSGLLAAAGQTEIRDQVSESTPSMRQAPLDVDVRAVARKGRLNDLPPLIGRQLEVLEFELGHGGYVGEVIKKYFEALSSSLRVVVVNDRQGKLFAIYNAADLISALRFVEGMDYTQLGSLLNSGDEMAQSKLAKLPGFIGADSAVTESTSKRNALAKMEKLNTDILPVVNEEGRFIGTVARSTLTAGLLLAVTDKLENH